MQEYWSGVPLPSLGEQTGNKLKLHPLILPSTGHTGDLGNTQLQPRGSRRLTCLDLPRDPVTTRSSHLSLLRDPSAQDSRKSTALICLGIWSVRDCHTSTCSGICQSGGRGVPGGQTTLTCLGIWYSKGCHASTCLGIQQSRVPRKSTCLHLPKDSIFRRLSCLNLPEDLHPDAGMPGSEVATVLGRISFRKTHP